MKINKICWFLPLFLGIHTSLAAQIDGGNTLVPNGVVLTHQLVIKEVVPNYDSLLQTIDTSSLIHYDTIYIPVEYDENGEVVAYDYVEVEVRDEPYFPIGYDSSEVLMALITLPKSDTIDISRLFLKLGENPMLGYHLLDTAYQPTESTSPYEIVYAEDFTVIVVNLGSELVGKTYYFGEVVTQNSTGALSAPFTFSATP